MNFKTLIKSHNTFGYLIYNVANTMPYFRVLLLLPLKNARVYHMVGFPSKAEETAV